MRVRYGSKLWLRRMYEHFNKEFFEDRLPKSEQVEFGWTDFKGKFVAKTHWLGNNMYYLEFDKRLRPVFFQGFLGMMMLHEMNHLQKGRGVDCQEWGGEFDAGMLELAQKNAMRGLW